jgi:hypothetical protein
VLYADPVSNRLLAAKGYDDAWVHELRGSGGEWTHSLSELEDEGKKHLQAAKDAHDSGDHDSALSHLDAADHAYSARAYQGSHMGENPKFDEHQQNIRNVKRQIAQLRDQEQDAKDAAARPSGGHGLFHRG